MDTPRPGESQVTATAAIDRDLSRHWVKRLARIMGVPTETARCWIYRGLPAARQQEIARALIAEADRLEQLIAETRRRWEGVANEASGAVARGQADRAGPLVRRVGGAVTRR
jgi:hypothetical protein